jgi:hypothetical protein
VTKPTYLAAAIFTFLALCPRPAVADDELMERFKAEAPKAWQAYQDMLSTLQGTAETYTLEMSKGVEAGTLKTHNKFMQGSDSAAWWRTTPWLNGQSTLVVEGANSRYSFVLVGNSEKDLRIQQLSYYSAAPKAKTRLLGLQQRIHRVLYPNFISGIQMQTLLLQKKFMENFTEITPDPQPGQERALKVAYDLNRPNLPQKGWIRVDPDHAWIVLGSWNVVSGLVTPTGKIEQMHTHQFDYDFTHKPPLLKRHKLTSQETAVAAPDPLKIPGEPLIVPKSKAPRNFEQITDFQLVSERGPEEKAFTLPAFGIPEISQAQWEEQQSVAELLEDNIDAMISKLNNPGANDASRALRNDATHFSGTASLEVTPFQRYQVNLPDWRFQIAENPGVGQYRYLRFAWKRTVGPGIMLQLHTPSNAWHRYYAGTVSDQTKSWGAMTKIADEPPRKWEMVTRDLFQDFGPISVTGIGFTPMQGGGAGFFDHIYLGRTIADLDRMTNKLKSVIDEAAPADSVEAAADGNSATPTRWKVWGVAIGLVIVAGLVVLFYFVSRSDKKAPKVDRPLKRG